MAKMKDYLFCGWYLYSAMVIHLNIYWLTSYENQPLVEFIPLAIIILVYILLFLIIRFLISPWVQMLLHISN